MTKDEILERIESNPTITINTIKGYLNSLTAEGLPLKVLAQTPTKFNVGDVIRVDVGSKRRPAVVIKVNKDTLFLIPLSTTEDSFNSIMYKHRLFGTGFFSHGLAVCTKEYAKLNFIGIFGNNKQLKEAIKILKTKVSLI